VYKKTSPLNCISSTVSCNGLGRVGSKFFHL